MQFAIGDVLEGKVTGITKFGAFIELGEGKTGMVHISEISTSYVEDIAQFLEMGQTVKVKVINITEEGKISLSMKKAAPAPAREPREPRAKDGGRRAPAGPRPGGARFAGKPPRREREARPFNPQQMSSYEWTPRKSESASFEDMLNKFKQTSDDKMSDLKKNRGEVRRGAGNRRSKI